MGLKLVRQCERYCDSLIQQAGKMVEPHDQSKLDAFAELLCGLGGLSLAQVYERLNGVAMPGDFPHLRLHDLTRNKGLVSEYRIDLMPMGVFDVVFRICVSSDCGVVNDEIGVWYETVALPVVDPGVLELGLRYRQRLPQDSTEEWIFDDHSWLRPMHMASL